MAQLADHSEISIALQTDKPIKIYQQLGRLIESLGFDGISVYNDLLYQPAWLPLFQLALATSKIRIGVASVNPFTSHPINIVGNIALIDEISNGRAYLGLSQGAWLNYLELASQNPISALKDAYRCIIHLLNKKREPFDSKYFPLRGNNILKWKIIRSKIPMLLGSWGPQTIKTCKPYITEVKFGGTSNPDLLSWAMNTIDDQSIGIVLGCVTVVDDDGDKARNLARKEAVLYIPIVGKLDPSLSISNDLFQEIAQALQINDVDRASEFIDDKLLAKFTFSGTPDEIATQAVKIFNSGASRIEFGTPHGINPIKGIEMLGKEVLPVIREKIGLKSNE